MTRALTSSPQPVALPPAPAALAGTVAAGAPAPAPEPASPVQDIRIEPSNDPAVRLGQADAFFRRNPGYMKSGGMGDTLRNLTAKIPFVSGLTHMFEPSEFGYGKLIHDQVSWQISSSRQPENEWWMNMNRHLIGDPLTAEAMIRSGHEDLLTTDAQHAWAKFIHKSDRVRADFGVQPDQVDVVGKDGTRTPAPLSDAWRGASVLTRLKAELIDKPAARNALWKAHKAALVEGRPDSAAQAQTLDARRPREMSFASSWANVVGYWAMVNPPAMGTQALFAQKYLLPPTQLEADTQLTKPERGFVKLLGALDHHYENEIHPTDSATTAPKSD